MHARRRPPVRRPRAHGFTLLELTLAAGIAAMLSLALYSAMNSAMRIRRSADSQLAAPRRAAIALDLLEADLQSVLPAKGSYIGTFIGYANGTSGAESGSLSFVTVGRDRTTDPSVHDPFSEGVRQVEISLQSEGLPSPSLVRRVTRNLLAQTTTEYEDEVLVDGVRSFGIRYFDGVDWYDQWDSAAQADEHAVPLAVEIHLELEEANPRNGTDAMGVNRGYRASRLIPIPVGLPASTVADTTTTGGE